MVEDVLHPQGSPVSPLQQHQRPFRESCQNCADSKVRCSKNKPTCARCARRGTPCVYQHSRRSGRKFASTVHAKEGRRGSTAAPNGISPPDTWAVNADRNNSLPSPPESATTSAAAYAHRASIDIRACAENLPMLDTASAHSDPAEPAGWYNEFFPSLCTEPDPFLCGDHPNFIPHASKDLDDLENGILSLGDAGGAAVFDDLTLVYPSLPSTRHEAAEDTPAAGCRDGETKSSSLSCNDHCPAVISRLLPDLFPSLGSTCERNQTQSGERQRQSLIDIVATNKRVSEAMSSMVECTCAQDIHVLFLIGLCTSKVMSYYLEATRHEHRKGVQRASDTCITNEHEQIQPEMEEDNVEAKIMSARMVLGELHRIQRLLARLSDRLTGTERKSNLTNSNASLGSPSMDQLEIPFTRSLIEQLDNSLRIHLRYIFTSMSLVAQRA